MPDAPLREIVHCGLTLTQFAELSALSRVASPSFQDALDARGGEDPGDLADAARAVDREDGGAASEGALEIEGGRAGADAEGEGARDLLAAAEREDGEGAFGLVRGEELEATFHATSWVCAANARGAVTVRDQG